MILSIPIAGAAFLLSDITQLQQLGAVAVAIIVGPKGFAFHATELVIGFGDRRHPQHPPIVFLFAEEATHQVVLMERGADDDDPAGGG